MIEAPHYTAAGARRDGAFSLPAEYFDGTVNEPVLHEAVRAYLNNQRQGTAATKTRSFVSGGNQKPWKQKGTGRARQGSTRAPHWRGGGTVFGPQPRDYTTDIPRKVRQLARRSALNARAREGAVQVIERLTLVAPKTSQLVELLTTLGIADRKVLVLTAGRNEAAYLSSRNLQRVHVMPYHEAAAYEILWSDVVLVEERALTGVMPEPVAADESAAPKKTKRAAKPKTETADAEAVGAETGEAKPKAKRASAAKASKSAAAEKPAKAEKAAKPKAAPKKKGSE
jgi:large subunit ribosomal protein L4